MLGEIWPRSGAASKTASTMRSCPDTYMGARAAHAERVTADTPFPPDRAHWQSRSVTLQQVAPNVHAETVTAGPSKRDIPYLVRGQTEFQVNLKLGLTPCPFGAVQPPGRGAVEASDGPEASPGDAQ